MKKEIKKLSLNKRTISNLTAAEMNRQVGAGPTNANNCTNTCTQNTCNDNYTCNDCKGRSWHGPHCTGSR